MPLPGRVARRLRRTCGRRCICGGRPLRILSGFSSVCDLPGYSGSVSLGAGLLGTLTAAFAGSGIGYVGLNVGTGVEGSFTLDYTGF